MRPSSGYPLIPLKAMDAGMLGFELLAKVQGFDADGREMVASAAQLASHLHRGQTRQHRGNMPRVPYIEHPLRVALRMMRWSDMQPGCSSRPIEVVAALLHDSIEDCSERIVREMASPGKPLEPGAGPSEVADAAAHWMLRSYGAEVTRAVLEVTNDPEGRAPYAEKMRRLCEQGSYTALLVKAGDLVDNAGSLRHQRGHVKDSVIAKRLVKYVPTVDLIASRLEDVHRDEGPVPSCYPVVSASRHLRSVESGLHELAAAMRIDLARSAPERVVLLDGSVPWPSPGQAAPGASGPEPLFGG